MALGHEVIARGKGLRPVRAERKRRLKCLTKRRRRMRDGDDRGIDRPRQERWWRRVLTFRRQASVAPGALGLTNRRGLEAEIMLRKLADPEASSYWSVHLTGGDERHEAMGLAKVSR